MKKVDLQTIVWKEGKHYVSQCLNFEVSSFGKSRAEAMKNLDESIELYFENEPTMKVQKIEKLEIVPFTLKYA